MTIAQYELDDYLAQHQKMLPTGPIWSNDPDSPQTGFWRSLAASYVRVQNRALALLVDAFPSTSVELLSEWESTLGLPDPCAGESPTLQQRQQQVVARFSGGGGQSIPYLVSFAAALGYTITITEFAPARAGLLRAGQPALGQAWAFAWQVNAAETTVVRFRAGESSAGEPLTAFGNAVLECELKRLAPAHTVPIFAYS